MTPTEIKSTLARLGGGANKRLGQHFLIDTSALAAIVDASSIRPGDRVLEVGPGLGVLTSALLNHGADVTAIEQDRRFAEELRARFADRPFTLVEGDAASIHWHEIVGSAPWKFVSNLPYGITSLALRKALWAPRAADRVVVLVQREVAERAIARDGKTSLLSLMVALASGSARIVRRVPAGAFYPPPQVESAILDIVPVPTPEREARWGIDPEKIMAAAKKGFAHPRKFLSSNMGIDPSILESVGVAPKARAEDLTPEEWASLAKKLAE